MTGDKGWDEFLREAATEGDLERVREALARGADPNSRSEEDGYTDNTPLYWAVYKMNPVVVKQLLDAGAKVEAELGGEETSLHEAAEAGHQEILSLLLEADGKIALNAFDYLDRTPLMLAVEHSRRDAARKLIQAGADVNAHNEPRIGETALAVAVEKGDPEMVGLLLKAGADPTIRGWMSNTPVSRAYDRVHPGVRSPSEKAKAIWEQIFSACRARGKRVEEYLPEKDKAAFLRNERSR